MLEFPTEIHFMIAIQSTPADIAALSRSCQQLHEVYDRILYEYNAKYDNSSALRSIFRYKEQPFAVTAFKKAIIGKANLQRTFPKLLTHACHRQYRWSSPGLDPTTYFHYLEPLHLAASRGFYDVVALLIDGGIDIDAEAE
ncbi:hypothetical protein F4778DRAFT_102723 [Xylariomycetidae sp. FL2044]|nr:hypothetical protein F4778DRAFT_102723 [Xylariomycetidae sp. FL2044]